MKHKLSITLLLVFLFLISHIIGLFIIKHYLPKESSLPLNIEKPQFREETSYIQIGITIIIATIFILLLLKFKAFRLFKIWFFFSVFVTLTIAFSAFINEGVAIALALILAVFKVFKHNTIIHNVSEVFVYGGLAAIFVSVLNVFSASMLLVIISVYDMIAVWKTKHMVSIAKFQSGSNSFAGLSIPYKPFSVKPKKKSSLVSIAILGGGDIGFTLMFSGAVLKYFSLFPALIISLCTAIALFLLFVFAKKQKFYPAMPFLSIGCFIGLAIVIFLF